MRATVPISGYALISTCDPAIQHIKYDRDPRLIGCWWPLNLPKVEARIHIDTMQDEPIPCSGSVQDTISGNDGSTYSDSENCFDAAHSDTARPATRVQELLFLNPCIFG